MDYRERQQSQFVRVSGLQKLTQKFGFCLYLEMVDVNYYYNKITIILCSIVKVHKTISASLFLRRGWSSHLVHLKQLYGGIIPDRGVIIPITCTNSSEMILLLHDIDPNQSQIYIIATSTSMLCFHYNYCYHHCNKGDGKMFTHLT